VTSDPVAMMTFFVDSTVVSPAELLTSTSVALFTLPQPWTYSTCT
jgi:hypothetical protein